ncbi:SIS domain-containing protein [Georgenia alba]|uniref:SIS domain-containing protein n=1 Tax=Georgenia alba TaxID=2233858 RepID=A0ABW2Q3I7_9MICO
MTSPQNGAAGALMEAELRSQPSAWRRSAQLAGHAPLPVTGQRVAVIGCGTSWFMAQSYAVLREAVGAGETDAWVASEAPLRRDYDVIVALSRSGTTTEVIDAIARRRPGTRTVGIVADPATPLAEQVDDVVALDFADEESVVQTRFATAALTLLRASLGLDVSAAIDDCAGVLDGPLPEAAVTATQLTFLGTGWTVGLAHEAALKNREASQSWTESYPAMDYRHGPIAVAAPGRATWSFGPTPDGLGEEVRRTGADFLEHPGTDPLADLVLAQRVALERSRRLGLDADRPRSLTRSVILDR